MDTKLPGDDNQEGNPSSQSLGSKTRRGLTKFCNVAQFYYAHWTGFLSFIASVYSAYNQSLKLVDAVDDGSEYYTVLRYAIAIAPGLSTLVCGLMSLLIVKKQAVHGRLLESHFILDFKNSSWWKNLEFVILMICFIPQMFALSLYTGGVDWGTWDQFLDVGWPQGQNAASYLVIGTIAVRFFAVLHGFESNLVSYNKYRELIGKDHPGIDLSVTNHEGPGNPYFGNEHEIEEHAMVVAIAKAAQQNVHITLDLFDIDNRGSNGNLGGTARDIHVDYFNRQQSLHAHPVMQSMSYWQRRTVFSHVHTPHHYFHLALTILIVVGLEAFMVANVARG